LVRMFNAEHRLCASKLACSKQEKCD
jgi:hypothetical protein